jgi:hypothetical protein
MVCADCCSSMHCHTNVVRLYLFEVRSTVRRGRDDEFAESPCFGRLPRLGGLNNVTRSYRSRIDSNENISIIVSMVHVSWFIHVSIISPTPSILSYRTPDITGHSNFHISSKESSHSQFILQLLMERIASHEFRAFCRRPPSCVWNTDKYNEQWIKSFSQFEEMWKNFAGSMLINTFQWLKYYAIGEPKAEK